MGKILAGLAILAVLLGAVDIEARVYAQRQLERRIQAKVPGATANVNISSFPFLGRLAVSGTVPKIRAHVTSVASGPFSFDSITLVVTGVRLNRNMLLKKHQVQLDGIDTGAVTADMSESELDRALGGVPVKLGDGVVTLTVAGVTLTARVAVVNNQLVVQAPGFPAAITIPKLPVLPCSANAVVTPKRVRLSCTFHQIPAALLNGALPVGG
jgi:hypothetical protein